MLIAVNNENIRILPQKGKRGFCPYCGNEVLAVCGEINVWHWRHDVTSNCDLWKEHETEWHRKWKDKFPEAWREFIITKNGEKHIADIRTDSGLIVEFQNSSISSETIRVREFFYGKMIWMINADYFKDNFSIRSLVKTRLRENEFLYKGYFSYNKTDEKSIKEFEDREREIERDIKALEKRMDWFSSKKESFEGHLENIEKSINYIVNRDRIYSDFREFYSENIDLVQQCQLEMDKLDKAITQLSRQIDQVNGLSNSKTPGYEDLKIVDFNLVSAKSYAKCKLIKKDTLNTFFPEVIDVKSESEFRWYSNQANKYLLLIDLGENIKELTQRTQDISQEKKDLEVKNIHSINALRKDLQKWLEKQTKENEDEIELLDLKIDNLQSIAIKLPIAKEKRLREMEEENLLLEQELNEDQKKKEIEIKKGCKGKYLYDWKHRRKSWDYAERPLLLDFGPHIFKVEPDGILIKMSIEDFIEWIKNH